MDTTNLTQDEYEMIATVLRRPKLAPISAKEGITRAGITKNKRVPASKAKKRMEKASRRINRK